MKTFVYESLEKAYPEIIKTLLEEGNDVSPRGMLTKELTPACITITNPRKRIIPSAVRKLNFGFMCGELIWMLQASNDVNFIGHYNSNWKNFTDDGATLNGAYGKRIFNWDAGIRIGSNNNDKEEKSYSSQVNINQFQKAYEQLKNDPDTRQATIVLFDPYNDYKVTKDKPCTNLLRFMIRDGKLNMTVFMRSNDIIMGTPYDIFNFTMMQELMASMLGIDVGIYNHIADSLHIYETHFDLGKQIIDENYPLLYSDEKECMKFENNINNLTPDLNLVFIIEKETRENNDVLVIDVIYNLNVINSQYWKSIAALLAVYNFRKYRRPQSELDTLKQYITSEFRPLIDERYNQLK
jgi:thymidylate synthase